MAYPPTFDDAWDETQPPDTQLANLLGQDIRSLKEDIRERLALISGTLANRPSNMDAIFGGAGYGILYFATDTNQIFQWNGAAWNQVFLSGNSLPGVSRANQNAAIGQTVIAAIPAPGGIYRVSLQMILKAMGTAGSIVPHLQWNDGTTAWDVAYYGPPVNTSAVGAQSNQVVGSAVLPLGSQLPQPADGIFIAGGTNLTYSVVFNGVTGTPSFDLRIRVEALG